MTTGSLLTADLVIAILAAAGWLGGGAASAARRRSLALGLAAYAAGRSGSPLCRPDSLWQYHGAWHVLSAAAAGWAARAMAPGPPVSVNQRG